MSYDFAAELLLATALADEGARVVLQERLGPPQVRYKEGDRNNPVTQYDVALGEHIAAGIARAYPNDYVLSEEDERSHAFAPRSGHRRVWCIDPIDGTRSFVAGSNEWAIMIGLAVEGRAQLGVVLAPARDTLWAGVIAPDVVRRAFVRQSGRTSPLVPSSRQSLTDARMVLSGLRGSRIIEQVALTLKIEGARQRLASVGLKAARVAEGGAEIYISASNKTHEWDACAPEAIARAAGVHFTDLFGQPIRYNKPQTPTQTGLLVSHGPHHATLAQTLLHLAPKFVPQALQQAALKLAREQTDAEANSLGKGR